MNLSVLCVVQKIFVFSDQWDIQLVLILFTPMSYFYTPENVDVFRGYRNETLVWKGLIRKKWEHAKSVNGLILLLYIERFIFFRIFN